MEKLKLRAKNALAKLYAEQLNKYMEKNGLTIDNVRERLYNNLNPYYYPWDERDIVSRILSAISHLPTYRLDPGFLDGYNKIHYSPYRDDIWAEYLSIPKNKRHKYDNAGSLLNSDKVIPSKYTPTINSSDKIYLYKTIDNLFKDKNSEYTLGTEFFVDYGLPLSEGTNVVKDPYGSYFGDHTIGKGFDDNGLYLSVYDLWDLAPFSNYGEDESAGIGTPIHFYDRLYLDDYFNFDDTIDGGVRGTHWLPSPIIETKVREKVPVNKKGSKIHIKKENRGKFTAAAKRAGMGVQEYASKVLRDPNASPQLKKRANFARNAKKWKHGN